MLAADTYRTHFAAESERILAMFDRAVADNTLDNPVAACPGWTLATLLAHVQAVEVWARHAMVHQEMGAWESAPTLMTPEAARATRDLVSDLLAHDPETPAWTFGPPRGQVAFWLRRQSHEHLIHRYDAETALGLPTPLPADLAADGVTEVVETFVPRQLALKRLDGVPATLRLEATDTQQSWTLGDGPEAVVSGEAWALDLLLWKRLSPSDERLAWSGDVAAGHAACAAPLVP